MVFVAIGYLLLAVIKTNVAGRYIGVCMIACTNAAVIPFIAVCSLCFGPAFDLADFKRAWL
jgi:hypothetical protein